MFPPPLWIPEMPKIVKSDEAPALQCVFDLHNCQWWVRRGVETLDWGQVNLLDCRARGRGSGWPGETMSSAPPPATSWTMDTGQRHSMVMGSMHCGTSLCLPTIHTSFALEQPLKKWNERTFEMRRADTWNMCGGELELIKHCCTVSRLMSVSVWSSRNEQSPGKWKSQTPAAC